MNSNLTEAKRCIQCNNPRCNIGCPISTDVKRMIELYRNNQLIEAGEMLFKNNPLSAICGRLCAHEKQCKGNCILAIKDEGVNIGAIEEEISTAYLATLTYLPSNNYIASAAVIGSGPAGLASALLLAKNNIKVTIIDSYPAIGGVIRYGIPHFRQNVNILKQYQRLLAKLNVNIVKQTLGKDISLATIKDQYDFVNICIGLPDPYTLNIKGNHLETVISGIDYLKDSHPYRNAKNIVIIGTGNVAMDVARTAMHHGAYNVTVVRRRGPENMSATLKEINDAKQEGVKFAYYLTPKEFTSSTALFYQTIGINEDGVEKLEVLQDSNIELKADLIVVATGQQANLDLMHTLGLSHDKWGTITVDDNNMTSINNIYASGDCILGAQTIVSAVVSAKKSVTAILKNT